ncbi:MAG: hypothetical protein Q9M41_07185 [Paracoccaceae bacterium]|nr:hypothetical protein [Paracoccaceae bacterium]
MNARTLTMIRNTSFSLLGLILLAYGLGVLVTGRTEPFPWWVTAVAGIATAVVVTSASLLAGRRAAAITWDELALEEWKDCLRLGYWVAVWLYPLFAVLIGLSLVDLPQSFAAMGTLTASAPFLLFLSKWLRGRV